MKAIPVRYEGETNIFTQKGDIIGWIHPAKDGSGYYDQYGAKKLGQFLGAKHATIEQAKEAILRVNRNLPKHVEII